MAYSVSDLFGDEDDDEKVKPYGDKVIRTGSGNQYSSEDLFGKLDEEGLTKSQSAALERKQQEEEDVLYKKMETEKKRKEEDTPWKKAIGYAKTAFDYVTGKTGKKEEKKPEEVETGELPVEEEDEDERLGSLAIINTEHGLSRAKDRVSTYENLRIEVSSFEEGRKSVYELKKEGLSQKEIKKYNETKRKEWKDLVKKVTGTEAKEELGVKDLQVFIDDAVLSEKEYQQLLQEAKGLVEVDKNIFKMWAKQVREGEYAPVIKGQMTNLDSAATFRAIKKWENGEELSQKDELMITKKTNIDLRGRVDKGVAYGIAESLMPSMRYMFEFGIFNYATAGLGSVPVIGAIVKAGTVDIGDVAVQSRELENKKYVMVETEDGFKYEVEREGYTKTNAWTRSLLNQTIQNEIEVTLGKVVDLGLGKAGGLFGKTGAGKAVTKMFKPLSDKLGKKATGTFMKDFARSGLVGEVSEEYAQKVVDNVINGESVEFSWDEFCIITGSVALISGSSQGVASVMNANKEVFDIPDDEEVKVVDKPEEPEKPKLPSIIEKELQKERTDVIDSTNIVKDLGDPEGTDAACVKKVREVLADNPDAELIRGTYAESLEKAVEDHQDHLKSNTQKNLGGFRHIRANVDGEIVESEFHAPRDTKFYTESEIKEYIEDKGTKVSPVDLEAEKQGEKQLTPEEKQDKDDYNVLTEANIGISGRRVVIPDELVEKTGLKKEITLSKNEDKRRNEIASIINTIKDVEVKPVKKKKVEVKEGAKSLVEEAKKYKDVKEFVKSQTDPLYEFEKYPDTFKDEFKGRSEVKEILGELGDSVVKGELPISKLEKTEDVPMERFQEYIDEIKSGIKTPIIVQYQPPNFYTILDGHHRVKAYEELGIKNVPVIVNEGGLKDVPTKKQLTDIYERATKKVEKKPEKKKEKKEVVDMDSTEALKALTESVDKEVKKRKVLPSTKKIGEARIVKRDGEYVINVGKDRYVGGGAAGLGIGASMARYKTREEALVEAKRLGYEVKKEVAKRKGSIDISTLSESMQGRLSAMVDGMQIAMEDPRSKVKKIFQRDKEGYVTKVRPKGFLYPSFIPEGYRTKTVVSKVVDAFVNKTVPKEGTKARELYDIVMNEAIGADVKRTEKQETEIKNLNKKFFGDENVGVVEQIITPEGQSAVGRYKQGWIDVLAKKGKVKDTFLHEAVHKALDVSLSKDQKTKLLDKIIDKYGEKKLRKKFKKYSKETKARYLYAGGKAKGYETGSGKFSALFDKKERFELSDKDTEVIGLMSEKEFNETIDQDKMAFGVFDNQTSMTYSLGQILDHPELYENYPELERIPVTVHYYAKDIVLNRKGAFQRTPVLGGMINPQINIYENFSPGMNEKIKGTLLHEIQHYIQEVEGFAKGGNISQLATILQLELQKAEGTASYREFRELSDRGLALDRAISFNEFRDNPKSVENTSYYYRNSGGILGDVGIEEIASKSRSDILREVGLFSDRINEEFHEYVEKDVKELKRLQKNNNAKTDRRIKKGVGKDVASWNKMIAELKLIDMDTMTSSSARQDMYQRLGGELEARDIQERMDMDKTERTKIIPYSIEGKFNLGEVITRFRTENGKYNDDVSIYYLAEEQLAEDFIKYVNGTQTNVSPGVRQMFDDLIKFIQDLLGSVDEIETFYRSLESGELATKPPVDTLSPGDAKGKEQPPGTEFTHLGKHFKTEIQPQLKEGLGSGDLSTIHYWDQESWRAVEGEDKVGDYTDSDLDRIVEDLGQQEIDRKKVLTQEEDKQDTLLDNMDAVFRTAPSGLATTAGYADIKRELPYVEKVAPVQLPELVMLVQEVTGKTPTLTGKFKTALGKMYPAEKAIKLSYSLFTPQKKIEIDEDTGEETVIEETKEERRIRLSLIEKVLGHELGHITDLFPDEDMSRGNILGRIATLKKYRKGMYGLMNNKEITKELKALAQIWNPFDIKNEKYRKYRYSSKELYADSLSVLFNDPALLKKTAPKFWDGFFQYLRKKPKMEKAFMDTWDMIHAGEEAVLENRLQELYKSQEEGVGKRTEIAERERAREKFLTKIKRQMLSKTFALTDKIDEYLEDRGIRISTKEKVRMATQKLQFINNKKYLYIDGVTKEFLAPLFDVGVTEKQMGAILSLERMTGDRLDVANPLGLQDDYAKKTLEHLRGKLTIEQKRVFDKAVKWFRDFNFKVVTEAKDVGLYSEKFYDEVATVNKDTYTPFGIIKYIEDNWVGAGVYKMKGTLSAHENPIYTQVFKTLSIIEGIEYQKSKQKIVETYTAMPELAHEFVKAKAKRASDGQFIRWENVKDRDVLEMYDDGKRIGYQVDPYIKDVFEKTDQNDLHFVVDMVDKFNQVFKPLVTTYKPSWAFYSNPVKDLQRTQRSLFAILSGEEGVKNIDPIGIRVVGEYVKAVLSGEAGRYVKGDIRKNSTIQKMLKEGAVGTPGRYAKRRSGSKAIEVEDETKLLDIVGKKVGVESRIFTKSEQRMNKIKDLPVLKQVRWAMGILENMGSTLEIASKIAGYQVLSDRIENPDRRAFLINQHIGTPNFREKGSWTRVMNSIIPFSNVALQAQHSDLTLMRNPKTRAGFAMQLATQNIWKIVMLAMSAGLLGDEWEKIMDKATEYDKTCYDIVPIGIDKNGDAIYWRIPKDEVSRLFGSFIWKVGSTINGKGQNPGQLVSLSAGLLPMDTTAGLKIASDWLDYAQGRNPYDDFRGREAIDKKSWEKGGMDRHVEMLKYTTNSMGLTSFNTYEVNRDTSLELVLQLPVLERMIKVTSYGEQETAYIEEDKVKREKALLLDEYVDEYIGGKMGTERRESVSEEFILDLIGKKPESREELSDWKEDARNARKKFMREVILQSGTFEEKRIVKTQKNAEKIALLKKYKNEMGILEWERMVKRLKDDKIISDNVTKELR